MVQEGALCALDMLSVAGLINYMGKIDLPIGEDEDKGNGIAIKPVMLRKGNSKLAMYGIGNVKDQRLHYELRSNRVRMFMPKDKKNWFNILLIHQNRSVPKDLCYYYPLTYLSGYLMVLNSPYPRACSTTT